MTFINFEQNSHVIVHKNQSAIDHVINFLFKPVQYFWNGKKIELIEQENNKACQFIGSIYKDRDHSPWKTAMMVALFIPGTILGISLQKFKAYGDFSKRENQFLRECLNQPIRGVLYTPNGQEEFAEKIGDFVQALSPFNLINTDYIIVFSEITHLNLLKEENQFNEQKRKWEKIFTRQHLECNKKILENIDLFWNLKSINFEDHYHATYIKSERATLLKLNPKVQWLKKIDRNNLEYSQKTTMTNFLKENNC